jgi:hypothetical protein
MDDMQGSEYVLYSAMCCTPVHKVCLAKLIDLSQALERRVVDDRNLLWIQPDKSGNWQEELLSLFLR